MIRVIVRASEDGEVVDDVLRGSATFPYSLVEILNYRRTKRIRLYQENGMVIDYEEVGDHGNERSEQEQSDSQTDR